MRYVLAIALILAAAFGLAWYRSASVQADLVEAAEAALAAAEAENVLVSVDGLEVTLAGEVPDAAIKERIDRAIARLPKTGRFVNAVEVAGDAGEASVAATGPGAPIGDASEVASPVVCQAELDAVLSGGTIDFASSSADLEPASLPLLDQIIAALGSCGEARVEIAGHTDASGPRQDNLDLSLQRADAVKAYLAAAGLAEDRLTAVGYGPDQPLVDNATPEGRARNRRIELKVLTP